MAGFDGRFYTRNGAGMARAEAGIENGPGRQTHENRKEIVTEEPNARVVDNGGRNGGPVIRAERVGWARLFSSTDFSFGTFLHGVRQIYEQFLRATGSRDC
jgi:hypothetical protein